jgi:hypothetical protein
MNSRIAAIVFAAAAVNAVSAAAQTPRVELSFFPSGHMVATEGKSAEPGFKNFTPGAAVAVNLTSYLAAEAEFAGALGLTQDLTSIGRQKSPSMISYSGNLVANLAPRRTVQPYLAVGVGGLQMFKSSALGIGHGEAFEAANAGGGIKVMFGRWGIRGDYRFIGLSSRDEDASAFIGSDVRHAHRFQVGFVLIPGQTTSTTR